MNLESIKFSVKEVIAIGAILVAVTGGAYVTMDRISDMGDDVSVMGTQVGKLTNEVSTLNNQMNIIQLDQKRIHSLQQWLLGEAIRDGWIPPVHMWILPEEDE